MWNDVPQFCIHVQVSGVSICLGVFEEHQSGICTVLIALIEFWRKTGPFGAVMWLLGMTHRNQNGCVHSLKFVGDRNTLISLHV